jgi:plasmid stabilization system protein ParE
VASRIIWDSEATIQFEKIQKYLHDQWGDAAVRKFTRRTFEFLTLLDKHPFIGPVEFPEKDIRGFVLTQQTKILYKVSSEKIILLSFFDVRTGSSSLS